MATTDPSPCPFCGAPALLEDLGDHHGAYHNLGCSDRTCIGYYMVYTESERTVDETVARWNRRAGSSVSLETLTDWKQKVNTLAALGLKAERWHLGGRLKQSIAEEIRRLYPSGGTST